MLTNKEKFEAAYSALLRSEGISEDALVGYFEVRSNGEYASVRTKAAWWGWQNNPELSRLRTACEKEFASVEELNQQVQLLLSKQSGT